MSDATKEIAKAPTQEEVEQRNLAENKWLQSMIDATAVTDPSIKERLTLGAVWQYMRLPDASFGWVEKVDGVVQAMPRECKAICVLTTLALGLLPGTGQILWLGNKVYITAEAKRFLAASSTDWVIVGKRILRAFTEDEKAMFCITEGDMACVIEQPVKLKGHDVIAVGYGIISLDELQWTNHKGKHKPGMQTKKDSGMTMITRAERDMLNRHFSVRGVEVAPDEPFDTIDVQGSPMLAAGPTPEQLKDLQERASASARLSALADQVKRLGGDAHGLLDGYASDIIQNQTAADMDAASDVLADWLDENSKPKPPTGGGAPAEKKKAGRPKKDAPVVVVSSPSSPPVDNGHSLGVVIFDDPVESHQVENPVESRHDSATIEVPQGFIIDEAAAGASMPDPVIEAADDEPLPPEDPQDSVTAHVEELDLTAKYTGEPAQLAEVHRLCAEAGISREQDRWAVMGGMQGRPMSDLPKCIGGLLAGSSSRDEGELVDEAKERALEAIAQVKALGGSPAWICGSEPDRVLLHPHPTVKALDDITRAMRIWLSTERAKAKASPPSPLAHPSVTKAYAMIEKALTRPDITAEVVRLLAEVRNVKLVVGDNVELGKMINDAIKGDSIALKEFIAARKESKP